ncbi:glycosyltransferase family 8 protein [Pectinatus haikarae]|uniref:Lipopolysaccharide biosynthesis glycosyltransferase n=1 Tax=Pectinatus haikarae TaxID=349096 RepID=A0ABT9Y6U6_9FIRM|nr:glycosyltransferase [Pectinatus haikarae]MDQ0203454.1 lipopolysaccharide biosynthesis glycosyltransferase [Pectinatus haikarae]
MDFFSNIIKAKKNIANDVSIRTGMNIAFGIDAEFALGMGVLMTSIVKNNPGTNIVFHIFTDKLNSADINCLALLGQEYKTVAVYIYYIDGDKFSHLPILFTWSKAIYYRFIICGELQNKTDKCLYLDSDILCLQPLKKLFQIDLDGVISAVAADYDFMTGYAKKNLGFTGEKYFNSGMMLINVDEWNKNHISEQSITMLQQKSNFKFYDQDVLNMLLADKILFLPHCYNMIYHLADMNENPADDTVFLHYSGSVKPWQSWGQFHFLTSLWIKYQMMSPWKAVSIQNPNTYKQAKFMARTMKKTGNFKGWLKWSCLYGLWKLRKKI